MEKEEQVEWSIIFPLLGFYLTFLGTETQHKLFQEKYKEEEEKVFPKWLDMEKTIKLAKDLGISVTTGHDTN